MGRYFWIEDALSEVGQHDRERSAAWDKLTQDTPMFVVESDATIVAPLMLSALLEAKAHPAEADALIAKWTAP